MPIPSGSDGVRAGRRSPRRTPPRAPSLLLALALVPLLFALPSSAVSCEVPTDYATIQAALDDLDCASVSVLPGTYPESLVITRSVVLSGVGGASATVLDVPAGEVGIRVAASEVIVRGLQVAGGATGVIVAPEPPDGPALADVSLEHLDVHSAAGDGIAFANAGGSVSDTAIHDNGDDGLSLAPALALAMSHTSIADNAGHGVRSRNSLAVAIADCEVSGNGGTGLLFVGGDEDPGLPARVGEPTSDLVLERSRVSGNALGLVFSGDADDPVTAVSLDGVSVEGNLAGTFDLTATESLDGVGLALLNASDVAVANSAFTGNGDAAIAAADASHLAFTANALDAHGVAWRLVRVDDSAIRENFVSGGAGVLLSGGSHNAIEENLMDLTGAGVRLEPGSPTVGNAIRGNVLEAAAPGGAAVAFLSTELNTVEDNVIVGPWGTGLDLVDVAVGDFAGNVIGGTDVGVHIDGGDALRFEGNVVAESAVHGIRIDATDDVEIIGNVVVASAVGVATEGEVLRLTVAENVLVGNEVGVRVVGPAASVTVRHNVVDSNVLGIDLAETSAGTVTYNIVADNTDAGIQVRDSDAVLVARNEVVVGGRAGIRILDSGSGPESLVVEDNHVSTESPLPGAGCPSPADRMYGIEVRRSNLGIWDNILEDLLHVAALRHCDSGYGIYVGESGQVPILRNVVESYQKYGILVEGPPVAGPQEVRIEGNEVRGLGPIGDLAQAGILVRAGAHARLEANDVAANWYTGGGDVGTGIGVLDAPAPVVIGNNTVTDNQYGIYVRGFAGSLVLGNALVTNAQGVRIESAGGTNVAANDLEGTGDCAGPPLSVGVYVVGSADVAVFSNAVEAHCWGIRAESSGGARVEGNAVILSDEVGIAILSSDSALVSKNAVLLGMDGVLVEDSASATVTLNLVQLNDRGIVVDGGVLTDVTWNTVRAGSMVGILLEGDIASYVYKNEVRDHGIGLQALASDGLAVDKNDIAENAGVGMHFDAVQSSAVVHRNEVTDGGVGIRVTGALTELDVAHNNIEGNEVGLLVEDSAIALVVEFNQITRNWFQGVRLLGDESTITRNVLHFNGDGTPDSGAIVVYGDSNVVSRNTVTNNDGYGILLKKGAHSNLISRNVVRSNTLGDCVDENPPGDNAWQNNNCNVQHVGSPPGPSPWYSLLEPPWCWEWPHRELPFMPCVDPWARRGGGA